MSWQRVVLLGEDRAHLDFLRGLCAHKGWTILDAQIAPRGQGAASAWVIHQVAGRLADVRAGYDDIGLLVAVDGDNIGPAGRRQAVRLACNAAQTAPPSETDAMALLIPTWSIDTWALFFVRNKLVPEHTKSKSKARSMFDRPHPGFLAPGAPAEDAPRVWKRIPLQKTIQGFLGDCANPELPSLDDARQALARSART